jgi:putative glutathione S-transferase
MIATATPRRVDTTHSDPKLFVNEADGAYKRPVSSFRDTVVEGGKFAPEAGRYRLYVSLGCPWATRTAIVRSMMGLEDIIPITIVSV